VYQPALDGDFVFDGRYLPFLGRGAVNSPLSFGSAGTVRSDVSLAATVFGQEPCSYHLTNVLLHLVNSALVN
jgi:hypothetical protein